MKPETKLKILRDYMDIWIDHYPHYKLCPFDVFFDLQRQKIRQKHRDIAERIEAGRIKTAERHKCQYCEKPFYWNGVQRTRDHVIPKSKGGGTDGNLVLACRECNQWKGAKDLGQWLMDVQDTYLRGERRKFYNQQMFETMLVNIRKIQSQIKLRA